MYSLSFVEPGDHPSNSLSLKTKLGITKVRSQFSVALSVSFYLSVLTNVQTDTIIHNIVVPTVSWIVAIVLAVLCKRMQQLRTAMHRASLPRWKNTTHKTFCLQGDHVLCACVALTMLEVVCKRIQHCCATLRRSRYNRNVGSCWL